ncbi:heavy-metal-associated domain-containing protein [Aneurinibacillus tyrosinisolvens]|uniref:heavy-metal-associated domain-containing protein n=1 Tax=Aneurinibacillus tyrosinisolvens TaxID=1443435 RepID=UPI00069C108C|nr:heavy-metal-associated domain-containing protein [Aneurinibacillus tyrosinisolvens]
MVTKKVSVPDMKAQQDAERIDKVLKDVWGVRQVEINLPTKEIILMYDEKAASYEDFQQALYETGFEAHDLGVKF